MGKKSLLGSAGAVILLLSGAAASGCTAAATNTPASHSPSASGVSSGSTTLPPPETTTPNAYNPGKPESCDTWSAIRFAPQEEADTAVKVWLEGPELVDAGPLDFARGEVALNDDGHPTTYTVAAGDSGFAIGERFCVDYITVFQFNHVYPIPHPGDVLDLHVDESVPFPVDPITVP